MTRWASPSSLMLPNPSLGPPEEAERPDLRIMSSVLVGVLLNIHGGHCNVEVGVYRLRLKI